MEQAPVEVVATAGEQAHGFRNDDGETCSGRHSPSENVARARIRR
jgi:hypothetical protein